MHLRFIMQIQRAVIQSQSQHSRVGVGDAVSGEEKNHWKESLREIWADTSRILIDIMFLIIFTKAN